MAENLNEYSVNIFKKKNRLIYKTGGVYLDR